MPKGGKYSTNPILVEDQREAQQRATRLGRTRTNALDPDYTAGYLNLLNCFICKHIITIFYSSPGNSPFAVNDVYSRAAQLGRNGRSTNYWNRRNPAEYRKKR